VPQIADAVTVPVVAAGGIGDARGIVAALALGAQGVQMGSAFLSCEGSGASAPHRRALASRQARTTGLTKGFTGRLARGIRNQLMDELNQPGVEILPYPLQRALVKSLTMPAEKAGDARLLPMWAGQSAAIAQCVDAAAMLDALIADVSSIAGSVLQWTAARTPR